MPRFFRLTRCPYCHRKISYISASFLKTKGEYTCESCKCVSNVIINKTLYAIASVVCIIALLIVLIYSNTGDHGSLWGFVFVLIPFILLYIIVPFFVRLEPCKDKSAVQKIKIKEKQTKQKDAKRPAEKTKKPALSKPIELDVEEDFSSKFMKTKSTVVSSRPETDEDVITDLSGDADKIEDIFSSDADDDDVKEYTKDKKTESLPDSQE